MRQWVAVAGLMLVWFSTCPQAGTAQTVNVEPRLVWPAALGAPEPSTYGGMSLGTTPVVQGDWQARFDRAVERKQSGRTKMLIGFPIFLAGLAGTYYSVVQVNTHPGEENWALMGASYGVLAGGGVFLGIGWKQMRDANRELRLLEIERTNAQKQAVLELSSWETRSTHTRVFISAGARMGAAVSFSTSF